MTTQDLLNIVPASTTVRLLHPGEDCNIEVIGKRYLVEQICKCLDLNGHHVSLLDRSREGELTIVI